MSVLFSAIALLWPALGISVSASAQAAAVTSAQASFEDFLRENYDNQTQPLARAVLTDLSALPARPFAGRAEEVGGILAVLAQKQGQKRSVLLTGPSGIGKGALIQHLASEVKVGNLSLDAKFLELDLARLSGMASQMAPAPGQKPPFEAFFEDVLPPLRDKAIIVMKGIEGLLQPGANSQFVERLRNPMERSGQRFIFLLENDASLPADHFIRKYAQKIELKEPDEKGAMTMLLANKGNWESAYGLKIKDEAIEDLVGVSKEFLRRLQPLELIDNMEAALRENQPEARKNTARASANDLFSRLSLALAKYRRTQSPKDYNEVLALAKQLEAERARLKAAGEVELDSQQVKEIMAEIYDNPMILKSDDFRKTLLAAVPKVRAGVVGQDEAVNAVSAVLKNTAAGLVSNKRPLGSFLLLGPTGVGKTQLARVLARSLFGDENAMARLDMSEYMEKHTVSRLIGSPPGYVGYGEGGQLTEVVRKRPYSVILFDEIEKAHADVLNVLLQILEDGRLTDGQGRTVDFRRTVVFMTSNLSSRLIQRMQEQGKTFEEIQAAVKEDLKGQLRPELIGRLDKVIVFTPLNRDQVLGIGELLANEEIAKPLAQGGHELGYLGKNVLAHVADHGGFDPEYGARPMRRAMQEQIRDAVTQHLLNQSEGPRKISIDLNKEGRIEVKSEALAKKVESKNALPEGLGSIWLRHILDPNVWQDMTVSALKAVYESFGQKPLQSQKFDNFGLQIASPKGETVHQLKAKHMDANLNDPALTSEKAPGGGLFGWMDKLRKEGYGDEELRAIQAWAAKALRCGKSAAAAQVPSSKLTLEWQDSSLGHVLRVDAPPLNEQELAEAYGSYEAHFSRKPGSLEETLKESDGLSAEGHRSRAQLMEIKRTLGQIPNAYFGAYWDKSNSTYWLLVPKRKQS